MTSKALTTVFVVLACIFAFPIMIGLIGGLFGIVAGLFGAIFGIIAGIFGAVIGSVAFIFGGIFQWGFGLIAWIIIIAVLVGLVTKRSSR